MKKDNKGFSLVEVIVVVAIAGVLLTLFTFGLGLVTHRATEECAEEITSLLQRTQRQASGKIYNQVILKRDVNGEIVLLQNFVGDGASESQMQTTVVGQDEVDIRYTLDRGATFIDLDTTPLKFSFERATGSIGGANGTSNPCTKIEITYDGGDLKEIELIPLTGKIFIKE